MGHCLEANGACAGSCDPWCFSPVTTLQRFSISTPWLSKDLASDCRLCLVEVGMAAANQRLKSRRLETCLKHASKPAGKPTMIHYEFMLNYTR